MAQTTEFEAIILAGGRSSRLAPLMLTSHKSLVPFCGIPFLLLLLEKLFREGCHHAIVVVGYHQDQVLAVLQNAPTYCKNKISVITSACGTLAALKDGIKTLRIGNDVICINSDTILEIWFPSLVRKRRVNNQSAILALTANQNVPNQGCVVVDERGFVIEFQEPLLQSTLFADLSAIRRVSNCGCYCFEANKLAAFLSKVKGQSIEKDLLPILVQNEQTGALILENHLFLDFGTPERFHLAQQMAARIYDYYKFH